MGTLPPPPPPVEPVSEPTPLRLPNEAETKDNENNRLTKGVDAAEILRILRRRLPIILTCVVVVTSLGAAEIYQIVPRYTAESAVMLEARKTQVVDVQAVLSGLPADMSVIRSEVEVLKSPAIAERVTRKLDLASLPEFNPSLRPASALLKLWRRLISIGSPPSELAPSAGEPYAATQADILAAVEKLQQHTDVSNELRSYVLKIHVESEDPKMAAAIANAYADAYLDSQLETKFSAVRRANNWLNEHLTELREQVEQSDLAVQRFKSQHNLVESKGVTVNAQQLGELNSQLTIASADRAQKESNLNEIQQQLRIGGADAAAQVLASPLIQKLRGEQTDLLAKQAQLATKYRPAHPAMIDIAAQLSDIQEKMQEEIDKVVRGMSGELSSARARESALRASLNQLEKGAADQGNSEVELRQLEREAESNRALYQNFLVRFKQTSAQEDSQQADARLLTSARIPSGSSYPQTSRMLMTAFSCSILIGLLAAFLAEQLDPGFRTREQFERATRVPSLGLVPAEKGIGAAAIDTIIEKPTSTYSEAIRTIRTALRYSHIDDPPKVVMITSSLPGEGKSVFSVSLARSVACSGGRALIIDCDLRRPTLGKLLDSGSGPGLLGLIAQGATFETVRRVEEKSGMHYIAGTVSTPNPQDLLGSNQMRQWLERLRADYDFIVLDTPPVLSVSDALVLSHLADTTIYLVRWGESARPVVANGLRTFNNDGGNLAGVVLSRVDMAKHSGYTYGEDRYAYGNHYAEADEERGL